MTVYRICRAKYPYNDGAGAALYGGRWNHKGTPLLYCGATLSLCALEVLANSDALPAGMVSIQVDVPDDISIQTLGDSDLPLDWDAAVAPHSTKNIGTVWANNKTSLLLSIPSVIVPDERNYLINLLHPDFPKIKFGAPKPFIFDPRLK